MTSPTPSPSASPLMRRRSFLAATLLLPLAACAGRDPGTYGSGGPSGMRTMALPAYSGRESFVWCVPYARELSGIQIRGNADTWWGQAAGRYTRNRTPGLGAVISLKDDHRLPHGHIGVVTGIVSPREIRVSHANWGWNRSTRGRIYEHMPAIDVSAANDWSQVRFKHPAVGAFGRNYPVKGFIHPHHAPATVIASR